MPATAAVPGLGETMAGVGGERDAARATATALETEVQGLLSHLKGAEQRQEILLKQLETAARTGLAGLGKVFERAEIDLDRILTAARVEYGGSGGPFQPITEAEAALPDTTEERVIALLADLERANLLKIAVARLPFGKPVEGARMTSAFGKRKDPIRRVWSMHTGMDYAAAPGTRIEATADGVVSFSGRMRGYGKIVIIKHAFGYETRYAHLRRRNVAVGQRVARGDVIGEMGNTGRSTGTHLHYEIRIDETPINPKKFIEAGRDVL
ncbi:MAG: M23 family metallopeptidase [Paracoccaceae bacterium]